MTCGIDGCPIAHVALGPKDDMLLFCQLRERQQQQRRTRAAEASRAFASEAAASAAMATAAQQSSQASSSGTVGSTIAQTLSRSTCVMASQPIVLTPEKVAIQQAALGEAQLQKDLGEIKAEKEKMIRRRARMQRRQADISELEEMNLTKMNDDVRTLRTALLDVVEMQDHQMALLQDILQSLAMLVGRAQSAPSPSGPGAWPVVQPPPFVPPVTGVSPYASPASAQAVSLGMPLTGGFSAGPSVLIPVQKVYSQPSAQVAVTGRPAVSQSAQPHGTQPQQQLVQQPAPQGPQPGVVQVPGQTQWVPRTTIASPKPFSGDKRGEDLDTWLSDDLPMDILLGMYYLSVAQPQFDWDRKVVKHTLPRGGTAILRKLKVSSLIESYGCMCAASFYNSYKQNPKEGMYLVYVSAAGEPVKMPPEIEGVVAKYPDLFEEPKGVVEREVVHAIKIIPGSSIPKGRIYRISPGELDELRRQLKELVEKGWIRPSVSPYGSPVLFVPKKGGTLRMCIDYRGLNAITVKSREHLPRIDDLLDRVQGCRYFSKTDLKFGYHRIAIWPEDQHKPAFQTRYGLYEFVVMPFGLCNAPGTFQHAMNRIFHDYLDKFVIVYLSDILIFSRTVEEHVGHLDKVLSLLRQHKFKINREKCEFGRTRILYLGHEISAEGLKPDEVKLTSIRDWPRPQYVTEMRSFLGITSYYRNFVKNYSIAAAPLTDLTCRDTPWEWTDSLLLTFKPRLPLDFLLPEIQPTAAPEMLEFAYRYEHLMQQAVEQMHKAQATMIEYENKHRRSSTFQVGDRVWAKSSELGQEHGISLKLMPQYFGPWEVLDIVGEDRDGPSYVIRIPGHLRTYPVFHASKLAPFEETDQFPSRCSMLPPTMDGEVDIDDIVDHREMPLPRPIGRGRPPKPKLQYRVRFRHHTDPKEDKRFTREELMQTAQQAIAHYEKSLQKEKRQIE
ncbi:hypothetical protein CBR_g3985 [Chara braunii]|uniref:Reverse transcriptase domain-containing protein n=1 Tax=Chara braunii TaxID=69332 RepID=A0A388KGY1_CHABU|nr:hypothetical protein CBR_g3985 [Chara braunii]|eukprot:GBG69286.1 hypothetical protein CBR_g3985 [Chara braunii]